VAGSRRGLVGPQRPPAGRCTACGSDGCRDPAGRGSRCAEWDIGDQEGGQIASAARKSRFGPSQWAARKPNSRRAHRLAATRESDLRADRVGPGARAVRRPLHRRRGRGRHRDPGAAGHLGRARRRRRTATAAAPVSGSDHDPRPSCPSSPCRRARWPDRVAAWWGPGAHRQAGARRAARTAVAIRPAEGPRVTSGTSGTKKAARSRQLRGSPDSVRLSGRRGSRRCRRRPSGRRSRTAAGRRSGRRAPSRTRAARPGSRPRSAGTARPAPSRRSGPPRP